ncbi:MAG: small acid-soluble spore protein SspI [Bacilli bacterium]|nr:small acid-soluble spore protein SspI [Bacilli bacterium]
MDDIKIRDYIINNFKDDDETTIKNAIEESIKENDEVTLPGMGVFFEIIWQDSTDLEKEKILTTLKKRFQNKSSK